jgi:hypothetical protein
MKKETLKIFKKIFDCYPQEYTPISDPQQRFDLHQETGGEEQAILEKFGICGWCFGSGTAYTLCCGDPRCDCGGAWVPYTCRNCEGGGQTIKGNKKASSKYISRTAEKCNGDRIKSFLN